jgi:hypothetical protein
VLDNKADVAFWVAIATMLGGIAQLAMVYGAIRRAGFVPRLTIPRPNGDVRRFWLLAIPAIWVWRWPDAWGWVLAVGVSASATVGQYFWVQAFKAGEMSAVAPFEYLRLPFAVFMGWLIFGQMPEIWTYVGAAIVIASALYIAQREAQLTRERRRAALAATIKTQQPHRTGP